MNSPIGFRVASYNVNDFDYPKADNKTDRRKFSELKNTVDSLDAGFIGLQEVRSQAALRKLNAALSTPFAWLGLIYGNSNRQQHIGFLSRYPVTVKSHAQYQLLDDSGLPLIKRIKVNALPDDPDEYTRNIRFQRDLVLADINTPNGRLGVFIVHMKSMRNQVDADYPENPGQDDIRRAECVTAKLIVECYQRQYPDRPTMILGDLNATQSMTSIDPLLSRSEFTDVLERDWIEPGNHPGYSYRNPPARARLDYLLLSKQAMTLYQTGSARIHRPRGWKVASDHLPVSAVLQL